MNTTAKKWMLVFFYMLLLNRISSIPGHDIPKVDVPNFDKVAHVVMYAGLGAVVRNAFPSGLGGLVIGSAYGALDEQYQRLVPGRSCEFFDWVADTIGAGLGVLLMGWYEKRRSQKKAS